MPDITTTQEGTVPSEEGDSRVWADLSDTSGKPQNGEILDREQDSHDGPLPDKHTLFLSFIAACDSMEDAYEVADSNSPETVAVFVSRFFSENLKAMSKKLDEQLSPEPGECDIFAAARTSAHKRFKDDAGNIDRILEECCHARGICGVKIGLLPLKDESDIKSLPSQRKPLQCCLPGLDV